MGRRSGFFLAAIVVCTATVRRSNAILIDDIRHTTRPPVDNSNSVAAECEVCDGGLCGVIPGRDPKMRCPAATPYCLNIINNDNKGSRQVTKRCGSADECEHKWWLQTSDTEECINFKADNFYPFSFSCTFCCTKDTCNKDLYPAQSTLYRSKAV